MKVVNITEDSIKDLLKSLLKRSPINYREQEDAVNNILTNVKDNGDLALFEYTEKFDKVKLTAETIKVTDEEIAEAYEQVDDELIRVIRLAMKNIEDYHEMQKEESWFDSKPDGTILGQKITPLSRVGVYVPGGKAAYPSSVLMNVIPAKVAGVDEIIMCTPPGHDGKVYPTTLVSAKEAGVDTIYKVGGAQAIGALAYGTESIPQVDKIVGPGNIFVALAKKAVFGYTGIDSVAGPSEILVLADDIIQASLDNYGYILIAEDMDTAIDAVNAIASEHLEIVTKDPFGTMTKVRNAGAIFLGESSSEPLGDYFAGPNHVLPTNGTARFFSPLGVDTFVKRSSIISYSRDALRNIHNEIETFAKAEGLTAHANSIKVRFEDEE